MSKGGTLGERTHGRETVHDPWFLWFYVLRTRGGSYPNLLRYSCVFSLRSTFPGHDLLSLSTPSTPKEKTPNPLPKVKVSTFIFRSGISSGSCPPYSGRLPHSRRFVPGVTLVFGISSLVLK